MVNSLKSQFRGMLLAMTLKFIIGALIGLSIIENTVLAQASATKQLSNESLLPKQTNSKKSQTKTTIVEVELLQADDGSGMYAQHWMKVLGTLEARDSLRIHRPVSDDKSEVKERESNGVRYVTAIGYLDRTGKIKFPDREFAIGDATKFKDWLNELRTYGALGATTGKPVWGLTQPQFEAVYDGMVNPIDFETLNIPLLQLTAKTPMPREIPLNWSTAATELKAHRADRTKLKVELKGLSAATALAVALNENGMGFRPNRTPRGDIEILIEPRDPKLEQWPIGWPLIRQRLKAAPKLFIVVPIGLEDLELLDVLNAASKMTEIPILVDYAELENRQIDIKKTLVSHPLKKTAWDVALKSMLAQHRLKEELFQDEAGQTFMWVTSSLAGRAKIPERLK